MASELVDAAVDPGIFAERILGYPLWAHQLEVARSGARFRLICAGRQVGKSRLLAVLALHDAATRRNVRVLLVSAGEAASQRLLAECASLCAGSDLMRGSVLDESKSQLVLSNGSVILSVPASEKQVRGWAVDLLIMDEAAFIANELWSAAEPAIIARPGSRVILASSPFGTDHFFRNLWNMGMSSPGPKYESWHWPSSISPLVDEGLLEDIRSHENPITFAREYLAEWADDSGLLLTPDELANAVLDYDLIEPELVMPAHGSTRLWSEGRLLNPQCVAGVDWGSARDASALVVLGALDDGGLNGQSFDVWTWQDVRFFIPWLEYHYRWTYSAMADRVAKVAGRYNLRQIASETNGVGAGAHEFLSQALRRAQERGELASLEPSVWSSYSTGTHLAPIWTDNRMKQATFGTIKGMLQAGTLVLPREVELLKQLGALTLTETATGSLQISVPERIGHDDLAMALSFAVSLIVERVYSPEQPFQRVKPDDPRVARTAAGTLVPTPPRILLLDNPDVFNFRGRADEGQQRW